MPELDDDDAVEQPLPPIQLDNPGRMIAPSLTMYRMAHKGHEVVRNGGIYTKSAGHLWSGDLDLTRDHDQLKQIATNLHETIYILRESDFVHDRQVSDIPWDKAVTTVEPRVGDGLAWDTPGHEAP